MTTMIDTLGYVKRLEAAGVPRAQAEAQAEALRDDVAPQLVTRGDLDGAVAKLDAKIDNVAAAARSDLNEAVGQLNAKIDNVAVRLDAKIDNVAAAGRSDLNEAVARIEASMLRNSVALLLGVLAIGSFVVRFLR